MHKDLIGAKVDTRMECDNTEPSSEMCIMMCKIKKISIQLHIADAGVIHKPVSFHDVLVEMHIFLLHFC